jgi:hypothetical protein
MPSKAIVTLVQIMESLPENIQSQVVEHLQEYIQQSNITLTTKSNGNLEISDEITNQQAKTGFDWEELRRRRDSLPLDPNPMTMEEICELVREVRLEKLSERDLS